MRRIFEFWAVDRNDQAPQFAIQAWNKSQAIKAIREAIEDDSFDGSRYCIRVFDITSECSTPYGVNTGLIQ